MSLRGEEWNFAKENVQGSRARSNVRGILEHFDCAHLEFPDGTATVSDLEISNCFQDQGSQALELKA